MCVMGWGGGWGAIKDSDLPKPTTHFMSVLKNREVILVCIKKPEGRADRLRTRQ